MRAKKSTYASALRGHQAAVDATKSQQREKAEWLSLHVFQPGTDPHRAALEGLRDECLDMPTSSHA